MKFARAHLLALLLVALIVLAGGQRPLRDMLVDMRFTLLPRAATGNVALVEIDSHSIARIGVWPWSRKIYADLIHKLGEAGATEIVFDIDFSSRSDTDADQALATALSEAGGSVILPYFKQIVTDAAGNKKIFVNQPNAFFADKSWPALVNVASGPDGLIRRYVFGEYFGQSFIPSVGSMLAGHHATTHEPFWIDFGIDPDSVPRISSIALLEGNPTAVAAIAGKKVIVAGTAIELGDRFNVPNGRVIPGSLLQALAAESLLMNRALYVTVPGVSLAGAFGVMLLMLGMWRRSTAKTRLIALATVVSTVEAAAIMMQMRWPIILDTSLVHAMALAYAVAVAFDEIDVRGILRGLAEKRFQRIAMSLGDGLVCAGPSLEITVWNPAAEAIFERSAEQAVGTRLDDLFQPAPPGEAAFSVGKLSIELLKRPGGLTLELRGSRKDASFPIEACFSAWSSPEGTHFGMVCRDISERLAEQERIRFMAEHDGLTGLFHRQGLTSRLDRALASGMEQVVLVVITVDRFQQINVIHGNIFGDQVQIAVAQHLREFTKLFWLGRVGEGEFGIGLTGEDASTRAKVLGIDIRRSFGQAPIRVGARQQRLEVRIGLATKTDVRLSGEDMLGNAQLARAHDSGLGSVPQFEDAMRDALEASVVLEAELALARENKEFELFYQPQMRLADRTLIGAEALIRWRHPTRGLVPPGDFIAVLNRSASSESIGYWVMEEACRQGKLWQNAGHPVRIGVNLSPSQLQSGNLPAQVAEILARTSFRPDLLELEVTEDIMIADDERARAVFKEIQAMGVSVAFDDFGTGFGSLSYLKKFPLDVLKIDKSFVLQIAPGSEDASIVQATISLGRSLGLSIIAEGIESEAAASLLCEMGCDEGQGYYFSRPIPATEFEAKFFRSKTIQNAA